MMSLEDRVCLSRAKRGRKTVSRKTPDQRVSVYSAASLCCHHQLHPDTYTNIPLAVHSNLGTES